MFTILIINIVMCIISYNVAKGKGFSDHDAKMWILWTVLFGIFALLVLLSKPKVNSGVNTPITNNPAAVSNGNPFSRDSMSPADEIAKYKMLLDAGAITKPEYEAKKKELLGVKATNQNARIGTKTVTASTAQKPAATASSARQSTTVTASRQNLRSVSTK